MKKVLGIGIVGIIGILLAYYAFIYFVTYSEGTRSGELIKVSHKGVIVKTWEGGSVKEFQALKSFPFRYWTRTKR